MTVRTGSYAKIKFPPTIGHDHETGLGFVTPMFGVCKIISLLKQRRNPAPPIPPFQLVHQGLRKSLEIAEVLGSGGGFHIGDSILRVDGHDVTDDYGGYVSALRGLGIAPVSFLVARGSETVEVTVETIPQTSVHERPWVYFSGLTLGSLFLSDRGSLNQIILSLSLDADGLVGRTVLDVGGVLRGIDGVPGMSLAQLHAAAEKHQRDGSEISLLFEEYGFGGELTRHYTYQLPVADLASSLQ